tara:strand:- start:306 stop:482 length:177 start_codon:yes stop_codon:yes gene_type:complete
MKKYKDATPEQIKEWHETEGKWWADRGLIIVAIASFLQFFTLGMMGAIMYGLDNIFGI